MTQDNTTMGTRCISPKTFDSFVVNDNNRLALSVAQTIAKAPGKIYNPVYIYGDTGTGKTHLLQAIENFIRTNECTGGQDTKAVFVNCETFGNELWSAIKENNIGAFRNKYRSKDVLLIDDIQFASKKFGVQDELIYTFNALYDAGKQLVFAGDCKPDELRDVDEKFTSRLKRGLVISLNPQNEEKNTTDL